MVGRRVLARVAATGAVLVACFAGAVAAQTAAEEQYQGRDEAIPELESRVEDQEASLRARIGEISAVGAELEEAQARVDIAETRAADLGEQNRELRKELAAQRESFAAAKAGYEEKARAAYKGGDLAGLAGLLDGLLGTAGGHGRPASSGDPAAGQGELPGLPAVRDDASEHLAPDLPEKA